MTIAAGFSVVHRDDNLLVIDKPAGASLLADRAGEPCLWDALKEWCATEKLPKPLLVHRLDKGTSGVLVVALRREAQSSLTRQFNEGTVRKSYLAVTCGVPTPRAVVDLPLREGRKSRYRVAGLREDIALDRSRTPPVWYLSLQSTAEREKGHASVTSYRVVAEANGRALVVVRPATGRTHQIRVHLAWLGWPIAGDSIYGKPDSPEQQAPRMMLHCRGMTVRDDWSGGKPRLLAFRRAPDAGFGVRESGCGMLETAGPDAESPSVP